MRDNKNIGIRKKGSYRGLIIAFAVATLFVCVVGGTVAYFFASTNNIVNTFVPGEVKCEVRETFENNVKSTIKVANTGSTPAYMRVCFTTHWVEKYTESGVDKTTVLGNRTATLPTFTLGADWVKGADGYYYYTKPVPPGEENNLTGELLGSAMTLGVDADNSNIVQVVEVFAEAIQSAPADAVLEAWGAENGGSVSGVSGSTLTVTTAAS